MLMKREVLKKLLNRIDIGDLNEEEELTLEELKMMCTHVFGDEVCKDGTVNLVDVNRYYSVDLWGADDIKDFLEEGYPELVGNMDYYQHSLAISGIAKEINWDDKAFNGAKQKAEIIRKGIDRWLVYAGYVGKSE